MIVVVSKRCFKTVHLSWNSAAVPFLSALVNHSYPGSNCFGSHNSIGASGDPQCLGNCVYFKLVVESCYLARWPSWLWRQVKDIFLTSISWFGNERGFESHPCQNYFWFFRSFCVQGKVVLVAVCRGLEGFTPQPHNPMDLELLNQPRKVKLTPKGPRNRVP